MPKVGEDLALVDGDPSGSHQQTGVGDYHYQLPLPLKLKLTTYNIKLLIIMYYYTYIIHHVMSFILIKLIH